MDIVAIIGSGPAGLVSAEAEVTAGGYLPTICLATGRVAGATVAAWAVHR